MCVVEIRDVTELSAEVLLVNGERLTE
jgi:hypothetical protein